MMDHQSISSLENHREVTTQNVGNEMSVVDLVGWFNLRFLLPSHLQGKDFEMKMKLSALTSQTPKCRERHFCLMIMW